MYINQNKNKRNLMKIIALILVFSWLVQLIGVDRIAFGAAPYTFRGYDAENITGETFSCQGASKSGTSIDMTSSTQGEAIGFISLDDAGANLMTSIDLGGLEIDFSTVTTVALEGAAGAENDVPTVRIDFCSQGDYQDVISTVNLSKPDNSAAGSVTLSSHASVPVGTRSVIIYLYGTNTNTSSENTVAFDNTSFEIHDAAPPSCSVSYNTNWTNQPLTVTVTASDSDSGLEGIYKDGTKVSSTSPYTFTVSANTSFSAYSRDYAGKSSDTKNISVTNIDTTVPSTPGPITLSNTSWTNQDVTVTMPSLGTSTGAPERYIYSVNGGGWSDLPSNFSFSSSGIYNLSVKTADAAGNISGAVTATANIDKLSPSINSATQEVSSGSVKVTVDASDSGLSGLDKMKYAAGSHDAAFFATGGTDITGGTFTVSAGGTYTVFVSDHAGNSCVHEYGLNTAPILQDITDKSTDEDTTLNVPVNVTDNETSLDKLHITASSSDTTLSPSIVINQSASAVSLDITPGSNLYGGPATITVEVEDEQGEKVSDTFTVTVVSVNDPPVAQDDSEIVTDEDKEVTIDVLANDSDAADGDSISITDPGTPQHGTVRIVDGKIVYTPGADYNGADSFTYTISDGNGGTANATVYINVTAVNDAPAAAPDTSATTEDTSVLINVLENDTDADIGTTPGEAITIVSVENGAHGTTSIEDGHVRYTPDGNWFGKDSFTYTIEDSSHATSTATVKVNVTGVEDAPWFEGLSTEYSIDEDSVNAEIEFEIKDIETPADSLMLQAVSTDEHETLIKNSNIKIEGLGDDSDSVTIKFTPEANMHGDVTINLTLGDGFLTTQASFILHINNVNDPPVAKADTVYYDEDTERITINVSTLIANDTDIDGDTLQFAGIVSDPSQGRLEAADGTHTVYYYYPKPDFDGADSFTYSVTDGTATSTGTCNVLARAVNDAPVLDINESYDTDEDSHKEITFNISDEETLPSGLIVNAGSEDTDLVSTDDVSVVNNGDGTCTISINPMADRNGSATITVTVSDGNLSTTKRFELVINPMPDAPVAVDDYAYIPVSGILTFSTLLNDRDPDGDALSVASYDDSSLPGTLTYDSVTKKFTYAARTGETGTSTFTYTVSDGDPSTPDSTATVTLDVNAVTHPPKISRIGDRYIYEDGSTGGIMFTATDVDFGEELTVTASSSNTELVPQDAEHMVLTNNGDGSYILSITPEAGKYGNVQITISVTDLQHNTVTMTFTLFVYKINHAPLAAEDEYTTNEDTPVDLDMLSNDSDPDGENIWIKNISYPSHGRITRSGSTYTYQPYGNYNGMDSFTYWVTDGQATVASVVSINVTPVNDAPVARDNWSEVPNNVGASTTISVLSNDYDVDGDTFKVYEIVSQGRHGTAIINIDGTITYTRSGESGEDNGADSFTYSIIDRESTGGDCLSDTATVYIGVEFNNSLYCDTADIYCSEDSAPFTTTLPVGNPNSVNYTLSVGTSTLGTLEVVDNPSGNDTQIRFTPYPNAYGYETIPYSAAGEGENGSSYIYIRVYPVNDAPVIDNAPSSASCSEDSQAVINADFHDIDNADSDLYFYAHAENISGGGPIPMDLDISIQRGTGTAKVTVTPAADTFGSADIVIGVSDGLEVTERTIHIAVNPVDDAPRINALSETMFEDTGDTFAVVTPATDVDGDSVTVSIAEGGGPAHGTAVVNHDGTITYTPYENWYGEDSLTFTVTDDTEAALSSTQTATLNVISVNDPPVITGLDYYQSTNEDTPKTVDFTVTDPDNDMTGASSYTITSSNEALVPAGSISISHVSGNDMAITLIPAANAYGKTVISITATDADSSHPLSAHAEFELTVVPVNDAPEAQDDSATVAERVGVPAGTTSTTINLTANDSDVDDTVLKVVSITNVSAGSVVNNKNGTVTFNVGGDFNGTATFDYTIMDKSGATDTATVTVNVTPMNDPPSAVNDSRVIDEDNDITIPVLDNDSDPEEDTLSITNAYGCSHGTATISGTNIIYSPNENYNGTDSFMYDVSDGHGGTASAHVNITIKPVNDPPSVYKHSSNSGEWVMNEDETKGFNFVDSDPETPEVNLIITMTSLDETILKSTNIKLTSGEGYKIMTVTPEENRNGTIPVQVKVTDGSLTTTEVFYINILPVNDPPVINAPARTTPEDTALSGSVTAADIDSAPSALTFTESSDPSHGTVTVNTDGTYLYTPASNWSGIDSFDVTVSDGEDTDTGTVIITVTPVNDSPSAVNDSEVTPEDAPVTINVLQNDTDADLPYGDSISIKSVGSASHGTASIVSGQIRYTPNENWNGSDSFTYTISDNAGKMSWATVSVTVTPVNDAPSGGDDTAQTDEDTAVTISVTGNDDIDLITNPGTEEVNVIHVDDPEHGSASISGDSQSIIYTPDQNWNGTEVFSYTSQDKAGASGTFSVTVTVNPVNDAPVIEETLPDVSMNEDSTSEVSFTVSDVEDPAGTLSVTVTNNNSTLLPSITASGAGGSKTFTIAPKANKNGGATITVTVRDSQNATATKTFHLTVIPVNDAPSAQNDSATTNENTAVTVNVLANDDVDLNNEGDTLTLLSNTPATYGSVAIVNNKIVYTPDSNLAVKTSYTDTFNYTMKDASDTESSASVTITVNPVNDPPTISNTDDITGIQEDAVNGTGTIDFTVQDEEDDDDTLVVTAACSNTELFPLANITITNPVGGTGSERSVKAVPAANKFGTALITLTVRDTEGLTATDTFTVVVDSVNDIPANGDDSYTVPEDTEMQLNVLANDDPDYATTPEDLTVTDITIAPSDGTVRIAEDGKSVYYKPNKDSDLSDTFQYRMHDDATALNGGYFTFNVNITIIPANDAPVVTLLDGLDTYTVDEGGHVNGIHFSVYDVDNNTNCGSSEDTISVKSSNPILVLGGLHINDETGINRNLDVQAYGTWNGRTTITITATDPGGLKGSASFTFIVNSVNEAPVAHDDTFTIPEDATTKVSVLANDTDGDLLTNPETEFIKVSSVIDNDPNAVITVTAAGDGVNIQPNPNYNGPVTFTYIAEDASHAQSNEATVSVTVSQVNDPPVAYDDSATTNEDNAVDIYVLSNDTDIDQTVGLNAHPEAEVLSISLSGGGLLAPAHGSISVSGNKIVYTPAANYNGTDSFEYYVSDGEATDKGLVSVTIAQVNDNPVAVTDSATTYEDTAKDIYVLSNDTDVDTNVPLNQDVLHHTADFSITSVGSPSHGGAVKSGDKIVYTPAANYFGSDTFTYDMSDGHGGSATGTINITVTSVNDLPIFDPAPADMNLIEDGADGSSEFTVSDVETAGTNLIVTVESSSNAALVATSDVTITKGTGGDRTVTVNPKNNQNGTAVIKLRVTDEYPGYTEYSFTVNVSPVNDPPIAQDITGSINEDTSYTVSWVTNTSDVDIATNGDSLHVTIESGDGAQHGTAAVVGNNLVYTPAANWNGIDSFTYTVTDSQGATDTGLVTVTVNQVNDPPMAYDDSAATNEDNAVDIYVLSNDTDIDMDVSLNAHPEAEVLSISLSGGGLLAPAHGSISISGDKIVYTPAANYNGTDSFEYYVSDGEATDKGLVSVTIAQVNDNPVAVTDSATTFEDTAKDIYVLSNDTDVDTNVSLNQDVLHHTADFSITSVGSPSHGGAVISGDKIVYTPAANYFGSDTFTYVMSDGHGGSATGTINVTVTSVNDLPVFDPAPADMDLIEDGADGRSDFTVSDVETAGTNLIVTVESSTNAALVATSDVTITKGTGGDRTVTVNPKNNQNGTAVIKLRVTDEYPGYTEYSFTVNVAAVNDPPIAQDITGSINEDTSYTVSWVTNTSDVDIATNGDSIHVTIESGDGAQHGTAAVIGNNLVYTPAANWNGTDSFTYTVTDSQGATDTGLVTVTVNQVNDPPMAYDDSAATNEDNAVDIFVLSNDTDIDQTAGLNAHPEAEVLSISLSGGGLLAPAHGSISVSGDKIVYTPAANYNGTDSFEYYVSDGEATDKGLVSVTIAQINDNPVAVTDSASTGNKEPVAVHVLDNDTDVDTNASLNQGELHSRSTFSVTSYGFAGGGNGELSESGGVITFTPDLNFTGIQHITYTLSDGHGGTSTGNVYINVGAQNAAPVANNDSIETAEDTPVTYNILGNDTDVDNGDVLSFVMFTEDTSSLPGDISAKEDGTLEFTPDANYHGSFTIGYEIMDSQEETSTATITITVTAVNDTPQAQGDSKSTNEDTAITINVSGLISDPDVVTDGDALTVSVKAPGAPHHGEFTLNGYNIIYTPAANWNGTDAITYTVTDSHNASDTGTITITVDPVNDSPEAAGESVNTDEDTPVSIDVLSNDADIDTSVSLNVTPQAPLTIDEDTLGTPAHGSVSVEEGKILYIPDKDYNGPDSFTYRATDGEYSSEVLVRINVYQVNDDPVASEDEETTTDGDMVRIFVLENDTDVDTDDTLNMDVKHSLDDLSITGIGTPSHGLAVKDGKTICYTPGATFAGTDSFTYAISDGHGGISSSTVTIEVLSANDPPETPVVATPAEGERYGGSSTLDVKWSGFDIDGDTLYYTLEYYDGSAWQVVETGLTDTSYDFVIPASLTSITDLQFRVAATDGEFTSGYGYSGHVSVDKDVPMNIVVRMTTADGKPYKEGTWTNQSVTVTAVSVSDASKVTFSYGLDSRSYAVMSNETVTSGVHNVYIKATDEFSNAAEFGGYKIMIDKQPPAVPQTSAELSGTKVSITFALTDDPGSSGNKFLLMPDGTKTDLTLGGFTWTAAKNGVYAFTIFDNAGNSTDFTVTVDQLDETPPQITCDSGDYTIGQTSDKEITASLTFMDNQSGIVEKGYAVSDSKSFSGAYQSYAGDITLGKGEHYIHAFAKNGQGLSTFETFGPFIVDVPVPNPSTGDDPTGDVVVNAGDVGDKGSKIRLPGGQWTDSIVLSDVAPGTYLVEVMDNQGNVTVVEVTITDEAVAAGVYKPATDYTGWYIWAAIGLGILIILLLITRYNVRIETFDEKGEKTIKTIRRLRRKKDEVTVTLYEEHVRGSSSGKVTLKPWFAKRMRGNTLIVSVFGDEVLNVRIPEDTRKDFTADIESWDIQ